MKRPSRTKRKRRRYQLLRQRKALARPQLAGGWGQGAPISRSDCLLVRQAIRESWPVSAEVRQLVVGDMARLALDSESTRNAIAAMRAILFVAEADSRARDLFDKQAKERQKVRKGEQPRASPENLPDLKPSDARDAAGQAVGVSGDSTGNQVADLLKV